ncbi:GNAT family N-acetyltransferase [Hoeflea olei]|uniref:N-acetyltransferase domain-containing protein n=1 Tax=Hoeflea olei TaxID=1480615 RepID=A0A1C1YTV3_9HYPH|nr:GNAT family N-acetyltransferase [Hoeflea olei]OCW56924.1 hypothetical protein AWJ14_07120 [Hoeflea olei]
MNDIIIRKARPGDAGALDRALAQLSADMGDDHSASEADIVRFCFGPAPVFHAVLAETADGSVVGVAAFSPFFSTVRGAVGLYVSDLWVSGDMRGRRLGPRLLAAARAAGAESWDARFMRLNVYHDNPGARAFYARLGFVAETNTQYMMLADAPFDALAAEA